jgi:acyl carrier protein
VDDRAIAGILRAYLAEQILQDPSVMIELDTPLLEWGLLNSLSTVQIIGFIRERFQVDVPHEEVVGGNFRDLGSISQLVLNLSKQASAHLDKL